MKFFLTLSLTIAIAYCMKAEYLKYNDCGSTFKGINVTVSDCLESPCVLQRGYAYDVEINAISQTATERISYVIQAYTYFSIPITIFAGDACVDFLEGACPVYPGQRLTFKANQIAILYIYPPMTTKVKITSKDDDGNILGCGSLAVKIV